MAIMPLDLTGSLESNHVTGETKTITRDSDRFFVPANGAIYDNNGSFKIYNAVNGARLQPNTQYRLLHLVDEAVKISSKNVYAVIYIVDKSITSVTFDYQAVGDVYQNIASVINDKLQEYLLNTTGSNSIGSVVGVPVQLPPEHHLQNINDFQGAGALVNVLESIRNAVLLGNGAAFAATYEYIDYRFQEALKAILNAFNDIDAKRLILEEKTQIRNGDYLVTSNPANPSSYLGYGNWTLDPNVLLYGADSASEVGNYLDVGEGTGYVAVKRYFWRRDDSAASATYQLATDATTVNEGQIVNLSLTTTGLASGTKIAYTISGVTEDDLVGTKLNGNFIVNDNGVATLPIEIRQDMETEGVEVMRVALTAMPSVYVDITINDTSVSAGYTLRFSGSANGSGDISSVNEGSSAYLAINTSGIAAGTRIYLLYNDSTVGTDDSATGDWPAYFDVAANGLNIVEYNIKADQLTEGVETLVVNACTTNSISSMVARAVLTINDTSKSATANLLFASNSAGSVEITQVNEGTTAYLFINTTNIGNGEFIDMSYVGTSNGDDFTNTLPSRVTINNNQAIITLNVTADNKTEGDETFVARASYNGVQIAEKTLIIKDTSVNPSYNLKFSTNSSGTDTITRANEGQSVYLYLETANIPDGTVLSINYSGTVTPANDFSNYPRSLTVAANRASGVIIIKADQLTEGEENVIVEVKNGTQTIGTAMLYINDTSASPTATIRFSTVASGSNTINQTNEGTTVYAIIETTNIANGTVVNLAHSGTATADDFVNTRASSVTINNNLAYVELQVKNDLLTEGTETYRLAVTMPTGEVITSDALTILDTSVPTLNVYFSANSSGTGQVTSFNEGSIAYLIIETSGIATGTTGVTLAYSGTTTESDIDNGTYGLSNVSISGTRTVVPYSFANDSRSDGAKTMTVTVTVPGITGSKQATITINDTSKYTRLTASGNIVVPAGKTARVILLGGTGMANYDNGTVASTPAISYMVVDGVQHKIASGNNGGPIINTGAIVSNGIPGAATMYPRQSDTSASLLNIDEQVSSLVDRDGIVQLITVQNKAGNDGGYLSLLNMPGISTTISDLIEAMGNPVVAPQQTVTVNGVAQTVTPGAGAGSAAIVMIYQNKGTSAKTIPVTLVNQAAPSVSGIRGSDATCFYEIFDSITEASLQYKPMIVATNLTTAVKNVSYPNLIAPGESYLVTLVSGGGASNAYYGTNPVARGQSAQLWFDTNGSANNILVLGGTAATSTTAAGAGGTITINGTLPSYASVTGQGGTTVANTSTSAGKDTDSPIMGYNITGAGNIPYARQFNEMPWIGSDTIAYGAPGFPAAGGAGVGGSGRAYSVLITNTGTTNISLYGSLSAYVGTAVNAQAGKPGAIIINKVTRKANVSVTNPSIVTEIYPSDTGVVDAGYTVVRGFNLADEFLKINNRLPTSSDAIVLDIPSNYAFVGSSTSRAGITIDDRCNAAKSIVINNNGIISGIGGTAKAVLYQGARNNSISGTPAAAGSAIINTSIISITVINNGTITGGGGYGGGGRWRSDSGYAGYGGVGGGGAPYGLAGYFRSTNGAYSTWISPATNATLLTPGIGMYSDSESTGGNGGNLGTSGGSSNWGDLGSVAGYIKEGNVTITNIGTGITKGR